MAKKQPQEAAATAKFPFPKKAVDIVAQTNKVAEIIKANPQFPNQPVVQTSIAAWEAAVGDVQANDQATEAAHSGLRALIAKRHAVFAAWKRATKTLLSAIDTVSAGSAKSIKDWGLDVNTHVVTPPNNAPPEPPRLIYNKQMEPSVRWKAVPGHRGYNLQLGDGTPTGWGPVIQVAQARYKLTGTTPGQHLSARVQVQRKGGLSAYSDPLTAVIR